MHNNNKGITVSCLKGLFLSSGQEMFSSVSSVFFTNRKSTQNKDLNSSYLTKNRISVEITKYSDHKTRIWVIAASQVEINYWPYTNQNQNQTSWNETKVELRKRERGGLEEIKILLVFGKKKTPRSYPTPQ